MSKDQEDVEIEWQEETIEFTVEFSYYAGCRGARDSLGGKAGMGPLITPDEGPEIDIIKVWGRDGEVECKNLKEEVSELIEKALWKRNEDNQNDYEADRAEARYEAMMDRYDARGY